MTDTERAPSILAADDMREHFAGVSKLIEGRWVPARPLGDPSLRNRICAAWLVFTGRADALTWTKQ